MYTPTIALYIVFFFNIEDNVHLENNTKLHSIISVEIMAKQKNIFYLRTTRYLKFIFCHIFPIINYIKQITYK